MSIASKWTNPVLLSIIPPTGAPKAPSADIRAISELSGFGLHSSQPVTSNLPVRQATHKAQGFLSWCIWDGFRGLLQLTAPAKGAAVPAGSSEPSEQKDLHEYERCGSGKLILNWKGLSMFYIIYIKFMPLPS